MRPAHANTLICCTFEGAPKSEDLRILQPACRAVILEQSSGMFAVESSLSELSMQEGSRGAAEEHHARGYMLRKRGDFQGAIAHYSRALEKQPDHFSALFNRGFSYDKVSSARRSILSSSMYPLASAVIKLWSLDDRLCARREAGRLVEDLETAFRIFARPWNLTQGQGCPPYQL